MWAENKEKTRHKRATVQRGGPTLRGTNSSPEQSCRSLGRPLFQCRGVPLRNAPQCTRACVLRQMRLCCMDVVSMMVWSLPSPCNHSQEKRIFDAKIKEKRGSIRKGPKSGGPPCERRDTFVGLDVVQRSGGGGSPMKTLPSASSRRGGAEGTGSHEGSDGAVCSQGCASHSFETGSRPHRHRYPCVLSATGSRCSGNEVWIIWHTDGTVVQGARVRT